jgi:hypothetical protein
VPRALETFSSVCRPYLCLLISSYLSGTHEARLPLCAHVSWVMGRWVFSRLISALSIPLWKYSKQTSLA